MTAKSPKKMTVTINLKTDKETKEKAQKIASELGFSLSSIINAYLKQFVRTGEISVTIYTVPLKKELEWMKDMEEAKDSKSYTSGEELVKDILNEISD